MVLSVAVILIEHDDTRRHVWNGLIHCRNNRNGRVYGQRVIGIYPKEVVVTLQELWSFAQTTMSSGGVAMPHDVYVVCAHDINCCIHVASITKIQKDNLATRPQLL